MFFNLFRAREMMLTLNENGLVFSGRSWAVTKLIDKTNPKLKNYHMIYSLITFYSLVSVIESKKSVPGHCRQIIFLYSIYRIISRWMNFHTLIKFIWIKISLSFCRAQLHIHPINAESHLQMKYEKKKKAAEMKNDTHREWAALACMEENTLNPFP